MYYWNIIMIKFSEGHYYLEEGDYYEKQHIVESMFNSNINIKYTYDYYNINHTLFKTNKYYSNEYCSFN